MKIKNLTKKYKTSDFEQIALNNVNLTFKKGELTAIVGESGSGKSTLLNLIGGLDTPTSGEIIVGSVNVSKLSRKQKALYLNQHIGYIFQDYNLLEHLTIIENVELPLILQGEPKKSAREKALNKLSELGLGKQKDKIPAHLSGGQRQRAAIARALVTEPSIILADEPTGALDSIMTDKVVRYLKKISADCIVLMVSHDQEMADKYADRVITLEDGKVVNDTKECFEDDSSTREIKKTHMPLSKIIRFAKNNITSRMLRNFFTACTVSIGITCIFLLSFLTTGTTKSINNILSEFGSRNIYYFSMVTDSEITEETIEMVKNTPHIDEVLYSISGHGMINYQGRGVTITISNLPSKKENFSFINKIVGDYPVGNQILITKAFAGSLHGVKINNDEEFKTVCDNLLGKSLKINSSTYAISGIVDAAYANALAYLPYDLILDETNSMNTAIENDIVISYDVYYNYSTIEVGAYFDTEDKTIITSTIDELYAKDVVMYNSYDSFMAKIDGFFSTAAKVLIGLISVSLLIAGILIGLVVYTSIVERTKEIGILLSIGAKKRDILGIFVSEAGIIGIISNIIALVLALFISIIINGLFMNLFSGLIEQLGFSTNIISLMNFSPLVVLIVFASTVLFFILVAIIPASRAGNLDAVKSLRRE